MFRRGLTSVLRVGSLPAMTGTTQRAFSAAAAATIAEKLKIGRLNHIAVATPDLKPSTALFRDVLGAEVSEPEDLPEHGVTVVFVNVNNTKIELLQPLGANSPIAGFLKKNSLGGMHHICLEVDDIHKAIEVVQENNVRCLNPEPKIGAHGKPVVFLHPKDCNGILVELEQV